MQFAYCLGLACKRKDLLTESQTELLIKKFLDISRNCCEKKSNGTIADRAKMNLRNRCETQPLREVNQVKSGDREGAMKVDACESKRKKEKEMKDGKKDRKKDGKKELKKELKKKGKKEKEKTDDEAPLVKGRSDFNLKRSLDAYPDSFEDLYASSI